MRGSQVVTWEVSGEAQLCGKGRWRKLRGSATLTTILGAVIAVLATFPLAALCALFFRFPVPFAGYLSGREAVVPALQAVIFYGGPFGGFVVQALLGGLGGFAAGHWGGEDRGRVLRLCGLFALLGSAMGVLAMSVLDKIIGPW